MSSSDYAIRVEGLGKCYRLGVEQKSGMYRYKSLRDSLGGLAKRPLQAARDLLVREPMDEQNSFWALSDVSFDVKRGEVVGIIGRNGAGKSTLLKVLSKITKPTTGHIEVRGRVGSLLEVGTGFHPELSGRENIYLNGAILGMTRAEVRGKFDEIVAFSEIEKFLDTPVKQYSSGMYTRLAFAIAAHLEPEILVVDEVLAVGDLAFQKKCLGKMKDVARGGRSVLFVSHQLSQIQRLCDSGILLKSGCVVSRGPIESQISAYMQSLSDVASFGTRRLLADVEMRECVATPKVIRSGDDCLISITLRGLLDTSIDDLCVLICAESDMRVAALDLQGIATPTKIKQGEQLTINVLAKHLTLVERDYSIGIFIRSPSGYADSYSLASFEVLPPSRLGASPVHNPRDRGYLETKYEVVEARTN